MDLNDPHVQVWLWQVLPRVVGLALLFPLLLWARKKLGDILAGYNTHRNITAGWSDLLLHAVRHTYAWFLLALSLFAVLQGVPLPHGMGTTLQKVFAALVLVQVGLWASVLLREWANDYTTRYLTLDRARVGLVSNLVRVGYMLIWALLLLLALDNFGVNITAMVAGLGIGGVAVAVALQSVLQDIFASFSIVFDKPFVIGDFVVTDDYMGSIEQIGMKTTRIRSLSGEQIIISNNDLLKSRIRNYGRMNERRVVFSLGVEYDTPPEKLEAIPGIIKAAIEVQPQTRFDRCNWINFGSYSLDFETVFYMTIPDNNQMIATREKIFLQILRDFAREGIGFAFPTQVELFREIKTENATSPKR